MDNFSQQDEPLVEEKQDNIDIAEEPEKEKDKEEPKKPPVGMSKDDDIKFDDVFDIDAIQRQLQVNMEKDEDETQLPEFPEISRQPHAGSNESSQTNNEIANIPVHNVHAEEKSKKYVIYINPENIDCMDKLDLNERKKIINDVLKEHIQYTEKQRLFNKKKKLVRHIIVACLTFIICFPIMFMLVNMSFDVSVTNYRQARENFVKLYRRQGKIQPKISN